MDSVTIRHTPNGLMLEAENTSFLISEKDIPLIGRGIARPVRTVDGQSLGRENYVCTRLGNLLIRLGNIEITIPYKIWKAQDSMRRVILSSH